MTLENFQNKLKKEVFDKIVSTAKESADQGVKLFMEELRRNKRRALSNEAIAIETDLKKQKIVQIFFDCKTKYVPETNSIVIELKSKI